MKQIILAAMAVMTLAAPASATSDWDMFWGTTLPGAFVELGSTLDPTTSGWNDFWYQCQDPDKNLGDCVGTVAAGIGIVVGAGALLAVGVVGVAAAAPTTGTVLGTGITASGTPFVWTAA